MLRFSSFLLSMASPYLHKMLCGSFREGVTRRVSLDDIDKKAFEEVLDLWCGKEDRSEKELSEVITMASLADRLQMVDIAAAVEDSILVELGVGVCAEVLISSQRHGLRRVEEAAWGMAVGRFEEVTKTAGFMHLDEETVGRLLDEDRLWVRNEEEALEGLVRWMKGDGDGDGVLRGRELLRKIRFGVIEQDYLELKAHYVLPEHHADWIDGLVLEAVRAKAAVRAKVPFKLRLLGAKALTRRMGMGVEWGRYAGGGQGRRLKGHSETVSSLAQCAGKMCSGSWDGSIRVWNIATLEQERVIECQDDILALAVREGELISGHVSGWIRVWDFGSGQRRRELEGHTDDIETLCVCGSRLASGSGDHSIKVWSMGPGLDWPCERTLAGHTSGVYALAGWEGKFISGSADETIRVWDASTGGLDATLTGHRGGVSGLVVMGERLFSASEDGTIRVWTVGTWAAVTSVEAYDVDGSGQFPWCLAVDGCKLICGSGAPGDADEEVQYDVRVWDPATMAYEHTVRQPAGDKVRCLLFV